MSMNEPGKSEHRVLFRIIGRILRRHAWFHLVVPLVIGIWIEALYSVYVDGNKWSALPDELLSPKRIVLYVGVFLSYFVVITLKVHSDTNTGLEQLRLNVLQEHLENATGIFAIGTMRFAEWFDPAVQVYLATLFAARLKNPSFQYERILLLGARSSQKNLRADYLDGYHARCLIAVHKRLGVRLYCVEAREMYGILRQLTMSEKLDVGWYPRFMRNLPEKIAGALVWPIRRRRLRRLAVAVMEMKNRPAMAFRFSKHDKSVRVSFEAQKCVPASTRLVSLIRQTIYKPDSTDVKAEYDFTGYYPC
jgi:hypothetical protein